MVGDGPGAGQGLAGGAQHPLVDGEVDQLAPRRLGVAGELGPLLHPGQGGAQGELGLGAGLDLPHHAVGVGLEGAAAVGVGDEDGVAHAHPVLVGLQAHVHAAAGVGGGVERPEGDVVVEAQLRAVDEDPLQVGADPRVGGLAGLRLVAEDEGRLLRMDGHGHERDQHPDAGVPC